MTLNERAHDKIYAKVEAIKQEIKADQYDIKHGLCTRFVPMELHKSVLQYKKKEKKIYEYILKLIKNA